MKKTTTVKILLLTILIFSFLLKVKAQTFQEYFKYVASDRDSFDWFGYSVDISGSYAIVGAFGNEINAQNKAGAAYIYKKISNNNWIEIKKITLDSIQTLDCFGGSVAIDGEYAIVGAHREDEDENDQNTIQEAGSVYIYKKDLGGTDNWGLVKKIVASDRDIEDFFGNSISISENYIVVGAYTEDEDTIGGNTLSNAGSAYVFEKEFGGVDNWGQIKKLNASDRGSDDEFGISVAIHKEYIIVGAYNEDEDSLGGNTLGKSGSAYIYYRNEGGIDNWGEVKKITALTRKKDANFGYSVSIHNNNAIVGAMFEDSTGNTVLNSMMGAAYIFNKDFGGTNNWGCVKKLVATDYADFDVFGWSVAINNDMALVGACFEDEDSFGKNFMDESGSAYVFKKDYGGTNNWGQIQKIAASDRDTSAWFGWSVAIDSNNCIIGAHNENKDSENANSVSESGASYLFNADSIISSVTNMPASLIATIYPNPASNSILINFQKTNSNSNIKIMNILGDVLITKNHINDQIVTLNISFLEKGIYTMKISVGDKIQIVLFEKL